ncbi:MAG TPA: RsiV family protein [Pseudolabrys sp.]|nr:RsiV family protein [Pseudolabrys sp.]
MTNARRFLSRLPLALLLGANLLTAAARADEKPALSVKNKIIEESVTIDGKLKTYPGLYDNLIAEGRRALQKWRAEAVNAGKETPDLFDDGRRYSFESAYTLRSAIGRYVSVVRADYLDGLGAHPNHKTDTILWDAKVKKRISIRPFFKETADGGPTMQALADAVRADLVAEKEARGVEDAEHDPGLDSVKPKLLSIGAIALAPSTEAGKSAGLIAYFSPYAVGPYVEGDYTAFVPWTAFKAHLSPAGAALFGGERPEGDATHD